MSNEYESLLGLLGGTPRGDKFIKNLNRLNSLLSTPEGKDLINLVAGDNAGKIKAVAESATSGNTEHARFLLADLLTTKDGKELVSKIIRLLNE